MPLVDSNVVNKVVYGGRTLIDLTGDTVTSDSLAAGVKAHDASGKVIVGEAALLNELDEYERILYLGFIPDNPMGNILVPDDGDIDGLTTNINGQAGRILSHYGNFTLRTQIQNDGLIERKLTFRQNPLSKILVGDMSVTPQNQHTSFLDDGTPILHTITHYVINVYNNDTGNMVSTAVFNKTISELRDGGEYANLNTIFTNYQRITYGESNEPIL